MGDRDYDFDSGVLTFNIDPSEMEPDDLELAFRKATHPAIAAPFIDMTVTNYISSSFIGKLVAAATKCLEDGRHLTVLAQKNVGMMLDRTGFAKVGIIKRSTD